MNIIKPAFIVFLGLTLSSVYLPQKTMADTRFEPSGGRFNLNHELRGKSNKGWKLNQSVRQKKQSKRTGKRWSINEDIRRNDTNSGFNYEQTDVSKY